MDSVRDLYLKVQEQFPRISQLADSFHEKRWGDTLDVDFEYAWFEALADALGSEMQRRTPYATHAPLFEFLAGAFSVGSESVQQCIDVSFVENLFWQVPSSPGAPYWTQSPVELQQLYMAFHHREPCALAGRR